MDQRDMHLDTYHENGQIMSVPPMANDRYAELPDYAETAKACSASQRRVSMPARVLLWILGTIVGITLLFGCGIFWVWGLDYLGVIDFNPVNNGKNEFNQDSGYEEFEDFYDYFDDYFGGSMIIPGSPDENSGSNSDPQKGTPGIGVTIQEVSVLEFAIDDKYTGGLVVLEISPTGALVGTQVQVGDLIVAANGAETRTIDDLDAQLSATGVGGEMVLTVARFENGVATTYEETITLIDLSTVD